MADITLDTFVSGTEGNTSSTTFAYTVTDGNPNNILLLKVASEGTPANQVILSATFNGLNMTKLRHDVNGNYRSEIWYLVNPPRGSAYNIVITYTGFVTRKVYSASSWYNVGQYNPFMGNGGDTGTASSQDVVISSVPFIGGMAIGHVVVAGSVGLTLTPIDEISTEMYDTLLDDVVAGGVGYGLLGTSGSFTFDYTFSASSQHAMSVCILRPSDYDQRPSFQVKKLRPAIFTPCRAR